MKPKVSITMPVLNGERYIGEAIESIRAQTYPHYELVVVDDGSTDETYQKVKAFMNVMDIKYVRHPAPQGIAPSMNDGVRHSTGDMIAFLDHDDAWLPDFLETQVKHMNDNPEAGMVHSDFQTTDVQGNVLEESVALCRGRKRPSGNVFRELFMDSFIVGNSVLIRKECFTRLGLFDETLKWGDYHMWLRIARHYRVDYVPRALTKYRQHPSQSTRSVSTARPDENSVAMSAIDKLLETYPELRAELGQTTINQRKASLYFDLAYSWYVKCDLPSSRVCLRRAIALWPSNTRYLTFYAATFLPLSQVAALRSLRQRLAAARSPERLAAETVQQMGSRI